MEVVNNLITQLSSEVSSKFIFNEFDDNDVQNCFVCLHPVIGTPTYRVDSYYKIARYVLHKSCAEKLPGNIRHHPLHPNHLLSPCYCRSFFKCNGCDRNSIGLKYVCKECKFELDVHCVSKIDVKIWHKKVQTSSLYHRHKLLLLYTDPLQFFEYNSCCCCHKRYGSPSYTCPTCVSPNTLVDMWFIHKSCLDWLPTTIQSSIHPQHPLSVISFRPIFFSPTCPSCLLSVNKIALSCNRCKFYFHVSCGSRTRPGLLFNFHRHEMHYVLSTRAHNFFQFQCMLCKDGSPGGFYRCIECNINVHVHCIPLPEIVEHESHSYHPLKLTSSIVTHRENREFRCDICEDVGDVDHHSYHCQECNYIAHIECVYPDVKDTRLEADKKKGVTIEGEATLDEYLRYTPPRIKLSADISDEFVNSSRLIDADAVDVHNGLVSVKTEMEKLIRKLEAKDGISIGMRMLKVDMVALLSEYEDLLTKSSIYIASNKC